MKNSTPGVKKTKQGKKPERSRYRWKKNCLTTNRSGLLFFKTRARKRAQERERKRFYYRLSLAVRLLCVWHAYIETISCSPQRFAFIVVFKFCLTLYSHGLTNLTKRNVTCFVLLFLGENSGPNIY